MYVEAPGILAESGMHEQFSSTAEVLGVVIATAPEAIRTERLHELTGLSPDTLRACCNVLAHAGLLEQRPALSGDWGLAGNPCAVTLTSARLLRSAVFMRQGLGEGAITGSVD